MRCRQVTEARFETGISLCPRALVPDSNDPFAHPIKGTRMTAIMWNQYKRTALFMQIGITLTCIVVFFATGRQWPLALLFLPSCSSPPCWGRPGREHQIPKRTKYPAPRRQTAARKPPLTFLACRWRSQAMNRRILTPCLAVFLPGLCSIQRACRSGRRYSFNPGGRPDRHLHPLEHPFRRPPGLYRIDALRAQALVGKKLSQGLHRAGAAGRHLLRAGPQSAGALAYRDEGICLLHYIAGLAVHGQRGHFDPHQPPRHAAGKHDTSAHRRACWRIYSAPPARRCC